MIKRIWLYPPLAFARVGSSSTPCENFYWGPDDLSPQGTARTQIIGAETLEVAEDGTVTLRSAPSSNSMPRGMKMTGKKKDLSPKRCSVGSD